MDTENISRNKVIFIAIFLLALIAIPLTVYMVMQRQQSTTKAAVVETAEVVAVIDGKNITKEQARKVAQEQNDPKGIGTEALKEAVDEIGERKALDKLATENNIKVSSEEIVNQERLNGGSNQDAKYAVIREKITKEKVKNWEVESVRFWIPADEPTDVNGTIVYKTPTNLTPDEQKTRLKQLGDTPKFLTEAEKLMKTSEALAVTESLAKKYPSLSNILTVNNSLFSEYDLNNPLVYEYKKPVFYTEDELTTDLYGNDIRLMKTIGEVKQVRSEHNGGGAVFKLISYNDSQFNSYEDLLNAEITKLKVNNLLDK